MFLPHLLTRSVESFLWMASVNRALNNTLRIARFKALGKTIPEPEKDPYGKELYFLSIFLWYPF